MNAAGPTLRDIHLPPVSWWPPAPGWWLLAGIILLAGLAAFLLWWRGRRARALQRFARIELDALSERHARDRDAAALAAGLSRLLRRIALLVRPDVVARDDAAWRDFLAGTTDRGGAIFSEEQLDTLAIAPYRAQSSFDGSALLDATRRWCGCALCRRALARHLP